MNFFILGSFFRVDFPPVKTGLRWKGLWGLPLKWPRRVPRPPYHLFGANFQKGRLGRFPSEGAVSSLESGYPFPSKNALFSPTKGRVWEQGVSMANQGKNNDLPREGKFTSSPLFVPQKMFGAPTANPLVPERAFPCERVLGSDEGIRCAGETAGICWLRGPVAILFISRDTCSDSIAKLFRACFCGVSQIIAQNMLQNGVSHRCACVKLITTEGYRTSLGSY